MKKLQAQKLTSAYLPGLLIREYIRFESDLNPEPEHLQHIALITVPSE